MINIYNGKMFGQVWWLLSFQLIKRQMYITDKAEDLKNEHFVNWPVSKMLPLVICQSQNTFVAIVDLPEGEHQYKFYVDGQWTHDPAEVSNSRNLTCWVEAYIHKVVFWKSPDQLIMVYTY